MAKVLFLQDVWLEYYGLMQLSALLKKNGHTTDILFASEENTLEAIKRSNPDLIAYSLMSIQWNWLKSMSTFLKKNGVKTPQLVGGIHPTMYPDTTINHDAVDIVCKGEGDYAMLDLCNAIDQKADYSSIKNLWVKNRNEIKKNNVRPKLSSAELTALPFADRDLYAKYSYFKDYPFVIFVGSRGCPFKCSFCEVPSIATLYTAQKSTIYQNVDAFIDEIDDVKKKGLLTGKLVMFTDSTFNSHKKWFLEFCQKYKERINLPWSCNLRAEIVNEEQVKALKMANCANVRFGVESGDESIRVNILKKTVSDQQIYDCANLLRKYKIPFQTFNMFAHPTETYEQAWKTIKLNQKIKPTSVEMSCLLLFGSVGVTDIALSKGLIEKKDLDLIETPPYNMHLSLLSLYPERNKDVVKICNLQKFAILVLRLPFTEPLVRLLVKLPYNRFFGWFYLACQAYEYRKWSTMASLKRMFFDGLLNYQALFGENQTKNGIFVRLSRLLVKKHRSNITN